MPKIPFKSKKSKTYKIEPCPLPKRDKMDLLDANKVLVVSIHFYEVACLFDKKNNRYLSTSTKNDNDVTCWVASSVRISNSKKKR